MRQRETNRWLKEEIVRKSNEGTIYSEGKRYLSIHLSIIKAANT